MGNVNLKVTRSGDIHADGAPESVAKFVAAMNDQLSRVEKAEARATDAEKRAAQQAGSAVTTMIVAPTHKRAVEYAKLHGYDVKSTVRTAAHPQCIRGFRGRVIAVDVIAWFGNEGYTRTLQELEPLKADPRSEVLYANTRDQR